MGDLDVYPRTDAPTTSARTYTLIWEEPAIVQRVCEPAGVPENAPIDRGIRKIRETSNTCNSLRSDWTL